MGTFGALLNPEEVFELDQLLRFRANCGHANNWHTLYDSSAEALFYDMRVLIGTISVSLALYAGEWTYRGFLRPVDQPTSALRAVATHFSMSGVLGDFYPVRHNFRHSSVTAVIAYKTNDSPLPFTVID
jgi:hypothetical protein